ncbi:MAG: tRNA (adenosine(37)-N6)-threonylcarbamoyltransferase complex transferase subunit TsaD [Alphaproteobacteria bacterium]
MDTLRAPPQTALTVLGIETSCDETAAAVLRGYPGAGSEILSNIVLSQIDEHAPYGGVVPEIAARAHIDHLDGIIRRALDEASVKLSDLDGIAATAGPGLIGGVMVGLMTGKTLAMATGKTLIGVNHLEGHALSPRMMEDAPFPYLLLLVSGGHCMLATVRGPGDYALHGETIDDAVGEAFDKVAKLLGLPYPGGPAVERWAASGDATRFALPRPLLDRKADDPHFLNFSLSGLKTAVRRAVEKEGGVENLNDHDIADVCASFQAAVADILARRCDQAMEIFCAQEGRPGSLVVAGGVAANQMLRTRLTHTAEAQGFTFVAPPLKYCTDNAAMIAWAGLERLALGQSDPLDLSARARWPLRDLTPPD